MPNNNIIQKNDHPLLEPITTFQDSACHLQPTSWLVEGLLTTAELASIIGAPASGKSFVALDLALSVASGRNYHGHLVTQGPVLYLAGEGITGLQKRAAAWCLANKQTTNSNLLIHQGGMDLGNPQCLEAYASALEDQLLAPPVLIVIDTLARYALSVDENSNSDMGLFIDSLQRNFQQRFNATILLIHHTGKHGSSARGASALNGAVDHEYFIKELSSDPLKAGLQISVETKKAKETSKSPTLVFDLLPQDITLATGVVETSLVPSRHYAPMSSLDLDLSTPVRVLYDTLSTSHGSLSITDIRADYQSRGLTTSNLQRQGKQLLTELLRVLPTAEVTPTEDIWEVLGRLVALQSISPDPSASNEI